MPDKGTLADKPAPEIFREMAAAKRSGVLRISSDRKARVVVFDAGRPVFAISNVPDDQIDVILVRQRKVTPDQATLARRRSQKESEIGPKLVEMGAIDQQTLDATRYDQVVRIIQNAMLSREGEYLWDATARVTPEITIQPNVRQWLLDMARNVPANVARTLLGRSGALYVAAAEDPSIEMSPLDSFILSRVKEPSTVDEIHLLAGLPEEQSLPTIYALFAAGLLTPETGAATATGGAPEYSVEEIRGELDQLLASYRDIELYDVLGVTRRADATELKRAYYALAKRYHPDRYRHASDDEVRDKLEAIFAQISRAYDTLKDERLRAAYDRRIGAGAGAAAPPAPPPPPASPPAAQPAAPTATPVAPPRAAAQPPTPPRPPTPTPPRPAAPAPLRPATLRPPNPDVNPAQLAEQHYENGRKRFENRDVMGAIHLLREAVRLAPNKGTYHLYLGLALGTNPRWYKEAEKHLLEASRTDPMNTQIFLKLGQIYQEGGLKKRAEAQFRAVLAIDPGNRLAKRALADMGLGATEAPDGGLLSKFFKKK